MCFLLWEAWDVTTFGYTFEKTQIYSHLSYSHLTFITDAPQRNLRTWNLVMVIYGQINCLMTARLGGGCPLFRNIASSILSPPRVGGTTSILLFPSLSIICIQTKMLEFEEKASRDGNSHRAYPTNPISLFPP